MKRKGIIAISTVLVVGGFLFVLSNKNKEVNATKINKEVNTGAEEVLKDEEVLKEAKVNEIYDNYSGTLDYIPQDGIDINEEDDNYKYGFLSRSLFFGHEYATISEVLYDTYNEYNYTVKKVQDFIYDITFEMKIEFEGIEEHRMVIRCDFNNNDYKLIGMYINDSELSNKEQVKNYIDSLKQKSTENGTGIHEPDESYQEENTLEEAKQQIINDFNNGMIGSYDYYVFTNTAKLENRMQVYDVNNDGNVLAKLPSGNTLEYIHLAFAKDTSGFWRVIAAKSESPVTGAVDMDPYEAENILIQQSK